MGTLLSFVIGLCAALTPAFGFILYYLHKKSLESDFEFKKQIRLLTIDSNQAKAKVASLKKQMLDHEQIVTDITNDKEDIEEKMHHLGQEFIKDTLEAVVKKVTVHNLEASKHRLQSALDTLYQMGIEFEEEFRQESFDRVQAAYDEAMKKEGARLEREKMKQRLQDEKRALEERDRQVQRLEKELSVIEGALEKALKKQLEHHQGEIEWLTSQLDEVKTKLDRAQTQADRTNTGYIYVASNVGSFGEGVYTLGMTKRLEPMDVVKELGDNSAVPFPFDVHMIVNSDNVTELEVEISKALAPYRLNKVDSKKAFFQVDLDKIKSIIEESEANIEYQTSVPEAIEYRESRSLLEEQADSWSEEDEFKKAA